MNVFYIFLVPRLKIGEGKTYRGHTKSNNIFQGMRKMEDCFRNEYTVDFKIEMWEIQNRFNEGNGFFKSCFFPPDLLSKSVKTELNTKAVSVKKTKPLFC